MPVEKRDRQHLNLNLSTQAINQDGKVGHIWNKSGQLDMFPNRWLRIGFAARKRETVFNSLLCHFNMETFREAFKALDGDKALGIDGISKKIYAKNLEENLQNLISRIHKGSYKPQDKREVLIPKPNGKTRPIAISCFEDKLVEWILGKILECIYGPIFIRNSFGFRPYHSAHDAVKAIYCSCKDNKRPQVVEIDFANFFNSIPHRKLLKILTKRISDRRFKGLIGRFLKVGILKQSGNRTNPDAGTPQGSIMSPILANVYLHYVLDTWFLDNYAKYSNIIVRYADDAVFFFKSSDTASHFLADLTERVTQFGLTLNSDKTKLINFGKNEANSFDFLGFTFYWGKKKAHTKRPLRIRTQQKTLHKKIQEFYAWIKSVRSSIKLVKIWKLAKAKLVGHYNYYGYDDNLAKLNHFYQEAIKSLFKWLNRRSQMRSFTQKQFERKLAFNPLPTPPSRDKLIHLRWRWAYVS